MNGKPYFFRKFTKCFAQHVTLLVCVVGHVARWGCSGICTPTVERGGVSQGAKEEKCQGWEWRAQKVKGDPRAECPFEGTVTEAGKPSQVRGRESCLGTP